MNAQRAPPTPHAGTRYTSNSCVLRALFPWTGARGPGGLPLGMKGSEEAQDSQGQVEAKGPDGAWDAA